MGRQILQLNQKIQVGDTSDMATVVSSMLNFPITDDQNVERRRRRLQFNKQNAATDGMSQATITSNSDYDEHLKIDRILYNCFGDMMSIARTTQIDFQTYSNGDDDEKCGAQNEAIENFLPQFIHDQSNEFIGALVNLNLLDEVKTPSVEQISNDKNKANHGNSAAASEDQNAKAVNNDGDGTNVSEKSSVYSIQHFSPIILNDDEIIEQTPSQESLHLNVNAARNYARGNGSNESTLSPSSSSLSAAKSSSKSFSRQATSYKTRDLPSFGHTSSQPSAQSTGHIASNFNASPNRMISNGTVFGGPTQHFEFKNANIGGSDGHSTFVGFENFTQGFQSLKNDFHTESWSFDKSNQGFSHNFFASEQPNNDDNDNHHDDGFGFDDKHNDDDFDHFLSNSFASETFSPQRKRPSGTSANLAINSNPGIYLIFISLIDF